MTIMNNPSHPGRILKNLYLAPLDMGAIALARLIDLPRTRIERLIKGETRMTPDTALRLAKVFKTSPEMWMNLQTNFDMASAVKSVDVSHIEPYDMPEAKVA